MKTPLIVLALLVGATALADSSPAPSTVTFKGLVGRRSAGDPNVKATRTFMVKIPETNGAPSVAMRFKKKDKSKVRSLVHAGVVREMIVVKAKKRSGS